LSTRRDEQQRAGAGSQAPSTTLARRRARVRFWRRLIIRLIAVLASLMALVGIVGSVIAYRQISGAQRSAQAELRQISDNFTQISLTLATVSTSAGNASASVGEARVALDDAAKTTRGVADTLDQTAGVINFTVPGTTYKPLAGVDTSFRDQARQLRTVADDVAKTNTALNQNGTDLKAISDDVSKVSAQMADIAVQLRSLSNDGDGSLTMITNATRLVIIWSGIIHLLLLLVGVSLFLLTVEDLVLANEQKPAGGRADVGDDIIEW
jgi:septal ring factor EnvC (AmiA/AmiB activator)